MLRLQKLMSETSKTSVLTILCTLFCNVMIHVELVGLLLQEKVYLLVFVKLIFFFLLIAISRYRMTAKVM